MGSKARMSMSVSESKSTPQYTPKIEAVKTPPPTEPRAGRSIILDAVHPRDFREMNIMYCCEQCSYFDSKKKTCAMGFHVAKHMRQNQLDLYYRTGKFAICRSQEID
jgi:hypothetical protein